MDGKLVHANVLLCNDLRSCDVITTFIFDMYTYCFNLLNYPYLCTYSKSSPYFRSAAVKGWSGFTLSKSL